MNAPAAASGLAAVRSPSPRSMPMRTRSLRATPTHAVLPAAARYDPQLREYVLPYEAVRNDPDPEAALLAFFRSAFEAAAENGRWDRVPLERSACDLN